MGNDSSGSPCLYYNFSDPTKYGKDDSLVVKPFISGFDVSSSHWTPIGIKTDTADTNSTTAWSKVSGYSGAILNSLIGSFVVFDPKIVGFLFSEGFIEQNFLSAIVKIEVPSNSITSFEDYVVGLSSFDFDSTNTISFTSTLNNSFVLQIGPIYTSSINYIGF